MEELESMNNEVEKNGNEEDLRHDDWDALLNIFIRQADKGVNMGITISCHGVIVSGTLIGRQKYFEGLSK